MPPLVRVPLAVALFAAAFLFTQWWDFVVPSFGQARYQAVHLANGQTYFARYLDRLGPYVKLEGIHYIQTTPSADQDKPAESRILRRGGELHAPLDRALVPKTSILFVEDLSEGSEILRFIDQQAAGR